MGKGKEVGEDDDRPDLAQPWGRGASIQGSEWGADRLGEGGGGLQAPAAPQAQPPPAAPHPAGEGDRPSPGGRGRDPVDPWEKES